jgi:ankyrin repeat protein
VAVEYGHVEAIKVLAQLGADKEAKDVAGMTPLHHAAHNGQAEVIKVLAELRAEIDARTAHGETSLQASVRLGHHQAAQVLRELELTARTRKAAATSERTQQAAEAADRMAAELIEEEEREQAECRLKAQQAAPQKEVRGV